MVDAASVDKRALRAVAMQFFVNGALFASFIPRLPEIRDRVGLGTAGIGLILSLAGVCGLFGSLAVSRVITRMGTRTVLISCGVVVALALPVVGFATTPAVLVIGLICMATFDVPVDVAMNMQGSWLSSRRPVSVMNRLHGLWSLGTAVGGVSSSRIASAGISLSTHLVGASVVLLLALIVVGRGLLPTDEHQEAAASEAGGSGAVFRINPTLVLFVLAGLTAVAIESTSIDWAAFRLSDDFGLGAGAAAVAYVAVTGGMTIGRLGGDWAQARIGQQRLGRLSVIMAGTGLALASLTANRPAVLIGFALAGLGIATMLPALYDAAAHYPGRPGVGLGALTAGLRTSGLVVPLVVGSLAATSLSVGAAIALITLPCVIGFAFVAARLTNAATSLDMRLRKPSS